MSEIVLIHLCILHKDIDHEEFSATMDFHGHRSRSSESMLWMFVLNVLVAFG